MISNLSVWLLVVTGTVYVLTLIFLVLAIRTRSMKTGLRAEDAWEQAEIYRDYRNLLYWWATKYFIQSISANEQQYRQKLRLGAFGFMLLGVQIGVGIASIVVTFN